MKTVKRSFKNIVCIFALLIVFYLIYSLTWKIPAYIKINSLNLPENCETVYDTKVKFSDIHSSHILGEKIIKCDSGLDYVQKYIEENNSQIKLVNIDVCGYFSLSGDVVYNSEYDDNIDTADMTNEEYDKYIKIRYYKKVMIIEPLFWYMYIQTHACI